MIKKLVLPFAVSLATIATPGLSLDLNEMTAQERAQFREEVRAYLMDNPEVIMEAVNSLEERQAAAQAQADVDLVEQNSDAIFNDGFSFVGGNPDGDVTMVEFMDYRCGYCKRAFGEMEKLLSADGNIRFIVKEFPILGEQSVLASRFAIATKQIAGEQAYKSVHDALMAFNGDINVRALRSMATTFGLDANAIEAHMNDDAVTEEIRVTRELAQRLKISGTPTFVLQDELLRGYLPADQMEMIVNDKRS